MRCPKRLQWLLISLCFAAVAVSGCDSKGPAEMVPMKGRVFLGENPLEFGTVQFQPRTGQAATGDIQSDGTFQLSTFRPNDGVVPGMHKVRITCYESQDKRPGASPPSDEHSLGKSLVPLKYTRFATSGIELAVIAGGNKPVIIRLEPEAAEEPSADEGEEKDSPPVEEQAEKTDEESTRPKEVSQPEAVDHPAGETVESTDSGEEQPEPNGANR